MPALKRRRQGGGKPRPRSHEVRQPEASRRIGLALGGATALITLAGCIGLYVFESVPAAPRAAGFAEVTHSLSFVGSEACAGCHRSETELWQASQHKQAMDHANEKTV